MVTLISPSKNGIALIKYLLDEAAHDGSEDRNICIETINLMPSDTNGYIRQFQTEWSQMSDRHTTQCRHLIFSPSENEIGYERENAQPFAEMVKKYITEHYPNRRAIIAIQQDAGGFKDEDGNIKKILHAHVCLSDADIYDYKAVPKDRQTFSYLKTTFDDFITDRYGIAIDRGRYLKKRKYLQGKLTDENERDEQGKFISYINDIKDRIDQCIKASKSLEDFWHNLSIYGLSVQHKERKKSHDTYETYTLHDFSNISDRSKDKNGNIKKLAKKEGQLPSIRSYKHPELSVDSIKTKIQTHIVDTKVLKNEETSKCMSGDNITIEKSNAVTDIYTSLRTDKEMIDQTTILMEKLVKTKKQEIQKKEKREQRYNLAQAELIYSKSKNIQKSL